MDSLDWLLRHRLSYGMMRNLSGPVVNLWVHNLVVLLLNLEGHHLMVSLHHHLLVHLSLLHLSGPVLSIHYRRH